MKKILFIHHGSHDGGAPLSMLYTMQGLRGAGYNPVAAIRPIKKLHELYNNHDFETIETPWVSTLITWSGSEGKRFNPVMWKGIYEVWKQWNSAKIKLKNLIKKHNIDIVHLNSVSLSNAATACEEMCVPYIWHVREHGPRHQGARYSFISKKLRLAKHVIFLSKAEQHSWTGGNTHGTVVHNFIDFKKFNTDYNILELRKTYNINVNKKVLLYVGGIQSHKGIITLLKSLIILNKNNNFNFVCLMPDSQFDIDFPKSRLEKEVTSIINGNQLNSICKLLPFNPNIVDQFALCDVLVFPAIKPHFARPIVEASSMKKPVVASNLKAIDELVINNKTGYLVPPNNPEILAEVVANLFKNPELCEEFGKNGQVFSIEEFEFKKQMEKIKKVYKDALDC